MRPEKIKNTRQKAVWTLTHTAFCLKGEDNMFNFLDIAPYEPAVNETVFSKEIIVGLVLFVLLVLVATIVLLKKKKTK